ncbi:hypothetical protein HFD88_000038 [Aspergillus terreus]|nr:hypothetical protein HFD88_000038 [Aspergillus terreus]
MTSDIVKVEMAIGKTGYSDITEVPIDPSVEDVYSPSLESVSDFCAKNGIEVTQFFKTLWAIVVRQCLVNGVSKFGFQDLRSQQHFQTSGDAIQIVQTSICDGITFVGFLANQHQQEPQQVLRSNIPAHRTAMILLDAGAEWEFTTWLEKQAGQKESYYHAVLVATFNGNIPTCLRLFYFPGLLTPEGAAECSETLSSFIEQILTQPSQRDGPAVVERLYKIQEDTAWNSSVQRTGMPALISDVIHQHAVDYPDKPAISGWDGELTYGQLEHTANCLARHLKNLGVRPGMLVLMIVERSTLAIIAELAIVKAGGAFVPVDPLQPQERLQSILEQTKSTTALVSEQFSERLDRSILTIITVSRDTLKVIENQEEDQASLPPVAPNSTAYVLFTSGSTGQPKGCIVDNVALADVRRHGTALKIRPEDRVLQFASYTFGVSIIEIYCGLSMGATICIPSDDDRVNRLTDAVNEMQVTWAILTPSTATSLEASRCKTLRTLVMAGEPMTSHTFQTWANRVDLYQGYGFTEWAGVCCVSSVRTQRDITAIGLSPTATLWLADPTDHSRPAAKGTIGELLVEGPSLASGYLDQDGRTGLAFLGNPPWLRNTNGPRRAYKTGDLVQYRDDGTLDYIGRKDLQVKIRGYRVELGEVEHSLRMICTWANKVVAEAAIPKVDETPVIAAFIYSDKYVSSRDPSHLLAHPTEDFRMDVKTVQKVMATALPEYMRPVVYLPLNHIPLTITGKIDRRALRGIVGSLTRRELVAYQSTQPKVVPPATPLERQLHQMFARILNLESDTFGIHDSFLQLGGDSVKAMRLVALSRRGQCQLSVSMILKYRSISRLVEQLEGSKHRAATATKTNYDDGQASQSLFSQYFPTMNGPDSPLNQGLTMLGISLDEVEDIYPCSPIQDGILLSQASDSRHYEMRFLWEIIPTHEGHSIDIERLRTAWRKLCRHHPLLRSRFHENVVADHYALQIVLKADITGPTVVQDQFSDPHQLLHWKGRGRWSRRSQPQLTIFNGMSGRVYTVLDISHVMVDAMSMSIITQDLASLYGGLCPPPPCLYRNYIAYLSRLNKEAGLGFWESRLTRLSPCIFPLLRSKWQTVGAQQLRSVVIDTTLLPTYRSFCHEWQITLATLFKIAWGLVLRCFTGNDDTCFGYMTAGRDLPLDGIGRTVGPFINLLICRIQFSPGSSLLQMAQSVQQEFIQDIQHQNVSYAEIRHALRLGDEKMFNTAMTFPPNLVIEDSVDTKTHSITYDIMVEVNVQGSKTECTMKYQTDFLSDEQARHLSQTLISALTHIVEHPELLISDVDLFHDGDEMRVAEWNRQEPEAVDHCVHYLVQQRCLAQPASLAVDACDGRWTYAELAELSSALAHQLQAMGVKRDVLVPLCFEKSRWVPVALLAVMKAGGAFCLLDPSHPVQRLQAICQQLKSSVLLSSSEQYNIARQLCGTVLVVGDGMDCVKDAKKRPLAADAGTQPTPSSALYVTFTSGSTGTPKGIVVEHRSLASTGRAVTHATSLTQEDRVLQFSSYAFDVSVFDHLVCFLSGACLCIPSEYDRQNRLPEAANDLQVTWAMMTPSMARGLQSSQLHTLRTLILAGETVLAPDIKAWESQNIRLFNMYGPAESAVIVTSHPCTDAGLDSGLIGKGLRAVGTWIVDPTNYERLMPVGAVGELVLEGPAVARGYLHNNCDRVPPFGLPPRYLSRFRRAASQDCRVYQTGDLVRYTPEGSLEYLGRKDTQVKIRGQRVELSEIESTIRNFLDGAGDAVAEVVKLNPGHMAATVVAFVRLHVSAKTSTKSGKDETDRGKAGQEGKDPIFGVPNDGFRSCIAELTTFLRISLPKYMVPAMFIPLFRLPVMKSGKVDRQVLRQELAKFALEDLTAFSYSQLGHRAPKTAKELQLQGLFAQALQLPRDKIWADSDFFLLGGDSIVAMNLVTAARNASPSLWLTVADIFSHPQLAQLADTARLAETNSSGCYAPFSLLCPSDADDIRSSAAHQCQVPSSDIQDIYPCTPLQEGLFALTAQQIGLYTAQSGFMIAENVNIARLEAAWASVVAANPILRTRIVSTEKHGLLQVVIRHNDSNPIHWQRADTLQKYLEEDLAMPMRPGNALVRFALVCQAASTHLLLTIHHALYDGMSMRSLLKQVKDAYHGQQLVTRPFAPFVQYLKSISAEETRQFWISEFSGLDAAIYPALQAGILTPSPASQVKYEITVNLQTGAGATLSNLIRLAWAIIMAQYTDNRDVVYGVTVSGRNAAVPEIEHHTGPTIATVPFRVLLDEDAFVSAAASSIQQHATRMIQFEQTGLQHIRAINADTAAACAFQSYLTVQSADETDGGSTLMMPQTEYRNAAAFTSYALAITCQLPEASTGGTIYASANFDSRLLPTPEAERMIAQFGHVLQQVCRHPTRHIRDLDMIGPADMMQLQCWNAKLPNAYVATVHESVLAQARLTPLALAVSSWDNSLTYGQLDSLSSGLASQLVQLGVKPGDFVPMCFERSTWPIVAMLAVLRVGGVCVNVDPGLPGARIQHILEDTKPKVILISGEKEQLMATASRSSKGTVIHILTADNTPVSGIGPPDSLGSKSIQVQPQDLAFVFFTSGSTGAPKGIAMKHENLMTSVYHHIGTVNIDSTTRALQFASHAFDMCLWEIFMPLMFGGSTFIVPQHERMSDLTGYIRRNNLNWAFLTPSTTTVLEPTEVPSLRTMLIGGEVVTPDHVSTWAPRLNLIHAYGPTETSVCVITGKIPVDGWHVGTLGPARGAVGWVTFPNDPSRLMPPGAIGELLVEGPLVTRGYLNLPEKTREAFIDPPTWLRRFRGRDSPGQLYRTGDLVRLAPDGQIQFLGRRDTQVKLRGQRLELAEIETHIRQQFPGPTTVAAEVVRRVNSSTILLAFVHCETDNPQVSEGQASHGDSPVAGLSDQFSSRALAVRQRLQQLLPSYMVPAALVPLSFVPFTATGKVDRQRLRRAVEELTPDQLDLYMSAGVQDPASQHVQTKAERILRDLWALVLEIPSERIDRNHQFFHLGGESIVAMKLAAAARRRGFELSVTQIFAQPRLADMAVFIGEPRSESACEVEEVEGWQELSPIQKLFFQYNPEGHNHFNQAITFRFTKPVSPTKVHNAIHALIETHSMLRARFRSDVGRWVQSITDEVESSYRWREQHVDSKAARSAAVARANETLDICNGPLLVATLLHDTQSQHQYLSLVVHHLVIDIVSWWMILGDLEHALRTGFIEGPRPMPFLAWCQRQASYAADHLSPQTALLGSRASIPPCYDAKSYWGLTDFSNLVADVDRYQFSIDPQVTSAVLGPANDALRTQPAEIIQGALLHAFVRIFPNRPPPVIYVEGHGREPWDTSLDLSRTVGWFTTISPTYVDLNSTASIVDVVVRTKDSRRGVPANGWAHFTCQQLNPCGRRSLGPDDLMEILFNYGGVMQSSEQTVGQSEALVIMDAIDMEGVQGHSVRRFSLIDVNAMVMHGKLHVNIAVNRHLQPQQKVGEWVKQCANSLEQAVTCLGSLSPIYTQSDFSQVRLTDDQLVHLNREIVPKYGLIEDIYPCTPAQRGILLSQLRNPEEYQVHIRFEAIAASARSPVHVERVKEAWERVVRRHAPLRTILLSLSDGGMKDQLVLEDFCPAVPIETVDDLALVSSSIPGQHPSQLTTKAVIRRTLEGRVFLDLSINHMFLDGGSIPLIRRDLTLAYDNQLPSGDRPSFGDYVARLSQTTIEPARDYWCQYTKGLEPCLVPAMIHEVDIAENGLATVELEHSTAALDQFCAEHAVSLTTLGHVAWALVLRCYTTMDDVCFGYAISARGQQVPRIREAVGLLINLLMSRIQVPARRSIASVLKAHQEQFLQHLSHQYYHIGDMGLAQRPTETFNTGFQIQRVPPSTTGSVTWKIHRQQEPTEYPILGTLGLFEKQATFEIAYRRSFASPDQAFAMAQAFREALTAIVEDPSQTVGDIELVSSDGRNQLASLNKRRLQEPVECVHWAIQARCKSTPTAPAVCSWDGSMTYQELDSRASILAQELVQHGVGPEQFVPLCLEKCQWVPVAVLAVLKAGGAFVLLDPSLPRQRLQANCEDVGAQTIISTPTHQALAASLGRQVLTISTEDDRWSRIVPLSYSISTVRPDNVAYAVFTSGSTGRPKATIMEHRAICANHAGQNSVCPIEPATRHFAFSSHAFDISVDELLSPMMAGACVCIPSETDRVSRLAEVAAEMRVTRASLASSVARMITPQEIPSMTTMVIGGETPSNIEVSVWSSIRLVFDYSPAECGAFSVARVCEKPVKDTANIGWPTSCARVWIVDPRDHTHLVPFGAVGEMLIEGPSVSRGYLGLLEKTRESFVEAPTWRQNLSVDGQWRMYRTGDLAQYQADGSIRFLGRRDTQVKLRGQRIELGEVEFHTKAVFPHTDEVVAEVVKPVDGSRPAVLAVFILQSAPHAMLQVSSPSDSPLASPSPQFRSDIKQALPRLRKALPRYMVPMAFLPLQRLPRTPSGKVDRLALRREAASLTPAVMEAHSVEQVTYRPPSTLTEGMLATVAARILQVPLDRVSVDGDLFEMGLDSIRAMTLVGLARKEHGLPLTVADVLCHPRIAELAQLIQPADETIGVSQAGRLRAEGQTQGALLMGTLYDKLVHDLTSNYPFARKDIEIILPTTEFQRHCICTAHRYYFVFRLPGPLNELRLRNALSLVAKKHSILRTVFVSFHDTVLQVVLRQIALPWISRSVEDVAAAVDALCSDDSRCTIPPGAPYLQLSLIRNRQNDRDHAWVLRSTHAQLDGVCLPRLILDLTATYNGNTMEPAPTFADFMAKRAEYQSSALFNYWRGLLDGASMTYLDPPSCSNQADTATAPSSQIIQQILQITSPPIPAPFTAATIHKAAWALLLARHTRTRDVVFGEVVNGRGLPMDSISDIMGPCITHIPVRVRLQPEDKIQELLYQIQTQHAQSMRYDTADMCEIVARSTSWPAGTYFGSSTQHQNIPIMSSEPFASELTHFETRAFNSVPRMPHVVSTPRGGGGLEIMLWADNRQVSCAMAEELLREFGEVFVKLACSVESYVGGML